MIRGFYDERYDLTFGFFMISKCVRSIQPYFNHNLLEDSLEYLLIFLKRIKV